MVRLFGLSLPSATASEKWESPPPSVAEISPVGYDEEKGLLCRVPAREKLFVGRLAAWQPASRALLSAIIIPDIISTLCLVHDAGAIS